MTRGIGRSPLRGEVTDGAQGMPQTGATTTSRNCKPGTARCKDGIDVSMRMSASFGTTLSRTLDTKSVEGEFSTWLGEVPTEDMLLQRFINFFFGQSGGPHATADSGLVRKQSLALCAIVRKVVASLWEARAEDIKALTF